MRTVHAGLAAVVLTTAAMATIPAAATTSAVPCVVIPDVAWVRVAGGQGWSGLNKGDTFYVSGPSVPGWLYGSYLNPGGGSLYEMREVDLDCPTTSPG
ncbi:hypothetical protein AB0E69_22520 [Kribbella sp. NPDC026611]|uniref:hypothetical protein n=1 Tax=Kribbella sp. NPDC026611 TaxID=3154911 RepID=UPI0033FADC45